MTLGENIKTALRSLRSSKARAFLTMLGIIIGISSFILINSVGAGAQSLILDQIRRIGSNLVVVLPGAADEKGPPASVFGINITTLKQSDIEDIAANIPAVVAAASYVRGTINITYEGDSRFFEYLGTTASYPNVEDSELLYGRFFTDQEDARLNRVVVLGSDVAREFFGEENPVGLSLRLKGEKYEIIGVFKSRGTTAFSNPDKNIFIPLNTAQKVILGIRHLAFSRIKIAEGQNIDVTMEQVREILRQNHRIDMPENDDFNVRSSEQALGILTQVTGALKLFLTLIAAISLIVGGIGIMNIMYIAVTERSFEIGLRKAIGATNNMVLQQFLTEAVVITLSAGVIGIIFGSVLSWIVSLIVNALDYNWDLLISPGSILFAFIIAGVIGISFGLWPARRAALKSPVEAMRGT